MRFYKNKWLCMLLIILIIATTVPAPAFAAKPDGLDSTNIQVIIKYKDSSKEKNQDIQSKVKEKKFKSAKKTKLKDTYIVEVSNTQLEELKKDTSIQNIEVDAVVTLLEDEVQTTEPESELCTDENHVHSEENQCLESCECLSCSHGSSEICECTDCSCASSIEAPTAEGLTELTTEVPTELATETPVVIEDIILPEFNGLETGNSGTISNSGDQYGWFVSRTKVDVLHNQNYLGNGVRVAIFDTGVNTTSGDIDLAGGVSFVDGVSSYTDDNGHGTKMASILSANLNGQGITGVAPNIDLYSVKVLDQNGVGRYSSVLNGVEWAIENNIQIIAMSFGGSEYSDILSDAINRAVNNNILVVAAVGNGGSNSIYYPAAFNDVISVGSSDSNNDLASFSNYGEGIDIVAPGTELSAYGLDGTLENTQGTSASVQQVAGAAALLLGIDSGLTNGQIKFLLYANTFRLEDYLRFGHGILDVEKAYQNLMTGDYSIINYDIDGNPFTVLGSIDIGADGLLVAQATCVTHSFVNYGNYEAAHPHRGYNRCSKCSATLYNGSTYSLSTCCSCQGHTYTNSCDSTCNRCSAPRSITHSFSGGNCKTLQKCSVCGVTGSNYGSHTWYNSGGYTTPHPHYGYDICSTCGNTKLNSITRNLSTCCDCNGGHTRTYTCDKTCNKCGQVVWPSANHSYYLPNCIFAEYCSYCNVVKSPSLGHDFQYYSSEHYSSTQDKITDKCSRCTTYKYTYIACQHHTHSYSTKVVTQSHTPTGHYYYWQCSCGETSSGGYQTLSSCASCTTPPSVTFVLPLGGQVYSETTGVLIPQINVRDNENDTLTCKYFIDGSTTPVVSQSVSNTSVLKLVTFTTGFNVSSLTEGSHTIKVEVSDGISPIGTATQSFQVDKSNPVLQLSEIEPSSNGFNIYVNGYDAGAGLNATPYQILIGEIGYDSGWSANNTFTPIASFEPDKAYTITIRIKDAVGHIFESSELKMTLPSVPAFEVSETGKETVTLHFTDNNPGTTLYEVKVGELYVNESGALVSTQTSITLNSKTLNVTGLAPNTSYSAVARAKTSTGDFTVSSEAVNFDTLPNPPQSPSSITFSNITQTSAVLEWPASVNASSYTLNVNGIDVITDDELNYFYENLMPNTEYIVKVKAHNTGGASEWSTEYSFVTEPLLGINVAAEPGVIKLSWEAVQGITTYDILVNDTDSHQVTGTSLDLVVSDPDVFYSFQIRGINVNGAGAYSEPVTINSLAKVPANLAVTNRTANSLEVTWQANGNPESIQYQIEAVESVLGVAKVDGLRKTNNWTYNLADQLTGLKVNQEYIITVKSRNSVGLITTETISCVGTTLDVAPESPINIISTATDETITLKWDPVYNAATYDVYRNSVCIAENIPLNSFVDTGSPIGSGLTSNTEYLYEITAVNAFGESAKSMEVKKRTLPRLPVTPLNISAASTKTSVTLSWDTTAGTTGYEVEWNGSIKSAGTINQLTLNGLEPGENYTYRIRSRNEGGKSAWSELTMVGTSLGTPNVPSELVATPSENKISLVWQPDANATEYQIEVNGTVVDTVNMTAYEILSLTSGATYLVRIRGLNSSEQSDWTTVREIQTLNNIIGAPVLNTTISTENNIQMEWQSVGGAIDYVVMVDNEVIADHIQGTNYTLNLLEAGTSYNLKIGVNKENTDTLYGNEVIVATLPVVPEFTDISATPISIEVQWMPVAGAVGYEIQVNGQTIDIGNKTQYLVNYTQMSEITTLIIRAYNQAGTSAWSAIESVPLPEINDQTPTKLHVESAETGAIVTWNVDASVDHYEVKLGDSEPVITEDAYIALTNLIANTEYTVSVRAVMDVLGSNVSDWSEPVTFSTLSKAPDAPVEMSFDTLSDRITIQWTPVDGVTGYEIMVDGVIVPVGLSTSYLDAGLVAESEHTYRVRSILSGVRSAWTTEQTVSTQAGLPGVPTNIIGSSTIDSVTFKWSPVAGASSYVIEVEGALEPITTANTEYAFTGLSEATVIKVRVSAVVDTLQSPFSTAVSCSSGLMTPENLASETTNEAVSLSWNAVLGATLYEIEVDGVLIGTTSETNFTIENVEAGTAIDVRVRAKNAFKAKSEWTQTLVAKAAPMEATIGVFANEVFDISLKADQIDDFSEYTFTIEYDTAMLKAIDLYSLTESIELGMGNIPGTEIRIVSFEPGKIVFKMSATILPGKVWSGVVTVIKLEALMTGQTTIKYRIK